MVTSNDKKVSDFIGDLQALANNQYEILTAIRDIVLAHNPDINESIKYGGIIYQKADELLAGLFAYKKHVSLELGNGFEIDDVYGVLAGSGKYRRHIKFYDLAEVEAKNTEYYVKASLS